MRGHLTGTVLGLAAALSGCTHINLAEPIPGSCELVPLFMEDFDTLSVSANRIGPARWTAHTPWNGDFGDARFLNPGPNGPFKVEDGILSITAKKNSDGDWTSGLLAAADRSGRGRGTQYGYFEARMKFPPGPGTWPAFWLVPLVPADGRDGNVEMGVIEYYGHNPRAYQSGLGVHSVDPEIREGTIHHTVVPPGDVLVNSFNTYGLDISPDWSVYFLNGEEVWRAPTPSRLTERMYPIVNLALGSGWPIDETPDPSVMYVDYVHVYTRSDRTDCTPGLASGADD